MSDKGYIKIFRSINSHWLTTHKPYCYAFAWIDLLMMANYNGNTAISGDRVISIPRGCIKTTHRTLMERWGWGSSKVSRFLQVLESDEMIKKIHATENTKKQYMIEIVQYSVYQGYPEQNQNINGTMSEQSQNINGTMMNENTGFAGTPINNIYIKKERKKEYKKEEHPQNENLFNQFWLEYPKKVSKQDAIRAFSKINENEIPLLMEALKKYKYSADWLESGGRFIPHPATWLNGRRWEDEIDIKIDQNPVNCINPKNPNEVILTNGTIYAKDYCVLENGQWRRK